MRTASIRIAIRYNPPPNTAATGAPTITGTAQVGETLTAATSGIMDTDGLTSPTYTYQWIRVDGSTETDISGATSSTYTLVAADEGKTIKVKVNFTDDASNAETLTSAATAAVAAAVAADDCAGDTTTTCSVSPGTPVTGDIEVARDDDYFSLSVTSGVTYQLDAEGVDTSKGTLEDPYLDLHDASGAFITANDDGGAGLNARVTWTASSTETVYISITSAVSVETGTYTLTVAVTNYPATGAPTISGTAQVGETLTAATSGIMDADGLTTPGYTYQWIRVDGSTEADISGATSSTYTLVDADEGKTIKVRVSFTDDASNSETLTSAATAAVAAAASTPAPAAISDLAATVPSDSLGTVVLTWTVPDQGDAAITKFQMRRKGQVSLNYGAWGDIASSGATTNSHTVTGLVHGWRYSFQVRAVNSHGEGADSNEAEVRTPADFERLQNGHVGPFGMWSPGGLELWVGRHNSREVRVYDLSTQDILPSKQWELAQGNNKPAGIWSDASRIYVVQVGSRNVYRYALSDKSLIDNPQLHTDNADPRGIWSDGTTVWVSDADDKKVYAYQLSDFSRDASKDIELHPLHAKARDIWSDGDWMWVLDSTDKAAYAYRLSDGLRSPSEDIVLEPSGQNYVGLWSDATTLYALDNGGGQPGRIYERPLSDRGWFRPQTVNSTPFVSRVGSAPDAASRHRFRQKFTTGPNPSGYYLAVVGLTMAQNASTAPLTSVSIHSAQPNDATQHKLFDLLVDQDGAIRYHRSPETAGNAAVLEANTVYWILITADVNTGMSFTAAEASGVTFHSGTDGWKLHTHPGTKALGQGWAVVTTNTTMSAQLNAWACVDEQCTNVLGHRPSAAAVTATRASVTEVDLAWQAPASAGNHPHYAIEGYLVERSTDGGSTWSELVRDLDPSVSSYSDSEPVGPVSTRRYRVVAANVNGYTKDADRSAGVAAAGGGHPRQQHRTGAIRDPDRSQSDRATVHNGRRRGSLHAAQRRGRC